MTIAIAIFGVAAAFVGVWCTIAIASDALDRPQERSVVTGMGFMTAWLAMLCRVSWRTHRQARQVVAATSDGVTRWAVLGRSIIAVDAGGALRSALSFRVSQRTRAVLSTPPRATVVK